MSVLELVVNLSSTLETVLGCLPFGRWVSEARSQAPERMAGLGDGAVPPRSWRRGARWENAVREGSRP